jgi:hypothetical protein
MAYQERKGKIKAPICEIGAKLSTVVIATVFGVFNLSQQLLIIKAKEYCHGN